MKKGLWICTLLLPWLTGKGQRSLPYQLMAQAIENAPLIDGRLDDACWQKAPRISNFTQRELFAGQKASERTEVAVVYNENFLYVGVWCYDGDPSGIIAKELQRDFNYGLDDNFILIIDPYKDQRNGYMFVTNPNAARADRVVFNNGGSSNAYWNGVWDVRTTLTDSGWFAEFEIPFYTLKYRKGLEEQEWGINFERNIRRKREQIRWQGWSRDNRIEQVNQAGTLIGLGKLTNRQFVEIKPYAIGGGERINNSNEAKGNIGGDVNYLITPTWRLNLTLNPDFAQVEADQQQVNLTRFPLFFPELREFFLEGDDYFDMGFGGNRIIPFYTRRIGLDENREAVPILGGARLLGKEANRTVGLMSLQTAETAEQASTNYTALSWRQDLGTQSIAGIMSSNTYSKGRWHSTTGVNGRYSTAKLFGKRNFDIGGAFIKTHNTDDGWQADAYAYRAFVSYPNDKYSIFASTQHSPEAFNPETGLMRRSNFREHFINFGFLPRPKKRLMWIRQYDFVPAQITYTMYNDTREIQSFNYTFRFFGFDTRSGESISAEYRRIAEGLIEDFNIRTNITIDSGLYWWNEWNVALSSFQGRTLSLNTNVTFGEFYNGESWRTNAQLLWRAGKHASFNLAYTHNQVRLPEGSFRNELLNARMQYAVNPNLFGSFLAQWNTEADLINFNFRLRWIPKIGTDVFLIVNQLYRGNGFAGGPERTTVLAKAIWRLTY